LLQMCLSQEKRKRSEYDLFLLGALNVAARMLSRSDIFTNSRTHADRPPIARRFFQRLVSCSKYGVGRKLVVPQGWRRLMQVIYFLSTYRTEQNLWLERYEKELKRYVDETDG
jgi:hypothetical protein